MRHMLIVGWLVMVLLAGCGQQAAPQVPATAPQAELVVFAAASLTNAFTEMGQDFEARNPDATVVFNFAGSQQLAQQLGQGAPADVFASANARQMEVAIEAGRVVSNTQQIFVNNRLVVVVPADNPGEIATLQDLAQPGLKMVLAAEDVPVGEYSRAFLDKAAASGEFTADYRDAVLANIVSYEENVRAILTKVALGEADAGIVYTSDVAPNEADQVQQIDIPDTLNTIAAYPLAAVSDTAQPALTEAFLAYVLSPEGQATLAEYGFIPVLQAGS
ncbi:MAG: molybdate ABC transporter substrate-binding protein [Chloroflexaceae bacterium]|nr:molybdate ABC transporter substrate-binding protein [Chloroflexaceae bacterium]